MLSLSAVGQESGKAMTVSLAAYCLCRYPLRSSWQFEQEIDAVVDAVANSSIPLTAGSGSSSSGGGGAVVREDKRPIDCGGPEGLRLSIPANLSELGVSTDYQFGFESLVRAGINCALDHSPQKNEKESKKSDSNTSSMSSEEAKEKPPINFLFNTGHIKNFYSLPSNVRVCQFPFEGGLVRKDLLLLTIRQYCYSKGGSPPFWWNPCYDLSTEFHIFLKDVVERYDATLMNSLQSSSSSSDSTPYTNNNWIFKPAQGHRGLGHRVIHGNKHSKIRGSESNEKEKPSSDFGDNLTKKGNNNVKNLFSRLISSSAKTGKLAKTDSSESDYDLLAPLVGIFHDIVDNYRPINLNVSESGKKKIEDAPTADVVAQLLITKPLTVRNRKLDLRVFVLVRSFVPFDAYFSLFYFARLANKDYDIDNITDGEVVLTVNAYNEDQSIASKQARLSSEELKTAIETEYPSINYDGMISKMTSMLKELFEGVSTSIGFWPRSSAYYAVDVIFDCDQQSCSPKADLTAHDKCDLDSLRDAKPSTTRHFIPTPKLLEINYMGDLKGVQKMSQQIQSRMSVFANSCSGGGGGGDIGEAVKAHTGKQHESHSDDLEFNGIYIDFIRDLMTCIGTTDSMNLSRNIKL